MKPSAGGLRVLAVVGALLALPSCASFRTMTTSSGDLEDYRAFRVSAVQGTRLSRAKTYLDRHPSGAFVAEVREAFDTEEPRYFEQAQASREGARRYLADLPDGPHAAAALALLTALESSMMDAELRDIARKARYDETKLEAAAQQRKAVGEAILAAVGVLLDESVFGVTREEAPPPLRRIMTGGGGGGTWGALPAHREDDFFFLLPTRPDRESRVLTLEVDLVEKDGRIAGGKVSGADLFVRWAEADKIQRLDASTAEDRNEAYVHALERLGGALERRFPEGSCQESRTGAELVHRTCNGWEVVVTPGPRGGDRDVISITGSTQAPTKAGDPAKTQGGR